MNIPEPMLPYLIPVIAIALLVLFFRLGMFSPTPPCRRAEQEAARRTPTKKINH